MGASFSHPFAACEKFVNNFKFWNFKIQIYFVSWASSSSFAALSLALRSSSDTSMRYSASQNEFLNFESFKLSFKFCFSKIRKGANLRFRREVHGLFRCFVVLLCLKNTELEPSRNSKTVFSKFNLKFNFSKIPFFEESWLHNHATIAA